MQVLKFATLPLAALAMTACESQADKQADLDKEGMEKQAQDSAAEVGTQDAVLGMSDMQLIDADLITPDGTELGDVEAVHRDAAGAVDGLYVELEDTDPDRFVLIGLDGLKSVRDGSGWNVITTMTEDELAKLPDAKMPANPQQEATD